MNTALFRPKPCPLSGNGVHPWVFHAACEAVEAGMPDEKAVEAIEARMTRPPNPASEIEDALRSARGERRSSAIQWPNVNHEQIEAIAQDSRGILTLWKSWRPCPDKESHRGNNRPPLSRKPVVMRGKE